MKYLHTLLLSLVALAMSVPVKGEEAPDTLVTRPEWHQLIAPGALIAGGSIIAAIPVLSQSIDGEIEEGIGCDRQLRIADALEWIPYATLLGAEYLGAANRVGIMDRTLLAATSFVILEAITQPLKRVANRVRPDWSDSHSFPSGHTATAFAGAELTRMAYGPGLGAAAYFMATGVAVLRMSGRHHYLSDCLAGAGIGILSARIAGWILPWERRLLRLDSGRGSGASTSVALVPMASADRVECNVLISF